MKKSLFFLLAIVAVSCKTTTEPSSDGGHATIIGRVHLAEGWKQTPPYSGIRASLEGTSFAVTTDSTGQYEFDSVPSGTYTVRFEKQGYGVVRWIGKSVEGGGNSPIYWVDPFGDDHYYMPSLFKIPNTYALTDRAYFLDTTVLGVGPQLVVEGSFQKNPMEQLVVFFGTNASVSPTPGAARFTVTFEENPLTLVVDTVTGRFKLPIALSTLSYFHLNSGDSVYLTTRTVDWHGVTPIHDYYDPQLGAYVVTSACPTPSPVIGLKIP